MGADSIPFNLRLENSILAKLAGLRRGLPILLLTLPFFAHRAIDQNCDYADYTHQPAEATQQTD